MSWLRHLRPRYLWLRRILPRLDRWLNRHVRVTPATGLMMARDGVNGEVGLIVRIGPFSVIRDVQFAAPQAATDGPVYNAGRAEGHADVTVAVRAIVDPDDAHHLNLDGALEAVRKLKAHYDATALAIAHLDDELNRERSRDDAPFRCADRVGAAAERVVLEHRAHRLPDPPPKAPRFPREGGVEIF